MLKLEEKKLENTKPYVSTSQNLDWGSDSNLHQNWCKIEFGSQLFRFVKFLFLVDFVSNGAELGVLVPRPPDFTDNFKILQGF
jgi:hypothetical protein